jgi:hypothetical protein
MSTVDTAQATDLQGAANAFEGILSREEGNKPEGDGDEAPQGANEAESPEQEETPTEEQSEEGSEGEEASAKEDDTEEPSQTPVLVTVKIDGKTEQLPIEEVALGYQRTADYTRKAVALANERKAFEADRQQVAQERAQYAQLLPALSAQLQQPEPDWQALASDPVEFLRQREIWRSNQERAAAAQYELSRTQQIQGQERQAQLQKAVTEGRQKLLETMPEWKDAKKWENDRVRLLDYGKKLGFTDEELGQTYDPRAVVALHKARMYDELMANKPKPVANKGPQVLPAGSSNTAPKNASAGSKAKNRLAQTGSVHDAAAYFLATEPG